MPWELIYTSAPRGLAVGQSGFCTVARTGDLREALAQRLQQISAYHYLDSGAGALASRRNPTIFAYRILDIRGTRLHVLSRVLPCGLDFTGRSNHLAHHLIFGSEELAGLPSPAAILRDWNGWLNQWHGEPRLLDPRPPASFNRLSAPVWPAETWRQVTGDAGRAAGLLEPEFGRGSHLLPPPGDELLLLNLFCETLQLLAPSGKSDQRAWQHTFTTFLQGEDAANDFHWRGCLEGTPAYEQAVRRSATVIPVRTIRIPNNPLAKLAREGPRATQDPAPNLASAGSRTLNSGSRLPLRTQPRPPVQFDPARRQRDEQIEVDSGGWNISISVKSLIGVVIASIILAGLLVAKHFLWAGKPLPVQTVAAAQTTDPTNSAVSGSAPPAKSPAAPASPLVTEPAPPSINWSEANQELVDVLPELPTYLFVVPGLSRDSIPLAGVTPLVKLLQRFGRMDVYPADLDLRFGLKPWVAAPPFPLRGDSDLHQQQLRLVGDGNNHLQYGFTLDYSSFPEQTSGQETVMLQTRFASEELASISMVTLDFKAAAASGLVRGVPFKPFELMVVNLGNRPPPLKLNKYFLSANMVTLEQTLEKELWNQLGRFQTGTLAWQLRPSIRVTTPGGKWVDRDFYKLLPPYLKPSLGAGLDFAEVRRVLMGKLHEQSENAGQLEKEVKIQQQKFNNLPVVDLDQQIGPLLGQTNEALMSFKTYCDYKKQTPSPKLFLSFLKRLTEAAEPQQPWLGDWANTHFESASQRLQSLYDFCAKNLPQNNVAALTIADGTKTGNYFVLVMENLRLAEDIQKLTEEKTGADNAAESSQELLKFIPENLEQVDHVSLFLADASNQLEMIRFTGSSK